jgi:co-chaperonin GroES (HSP10)
MTKVQMRGNGVLIRALQRKAQKIGSIELAGHLDREIDHAVVMGVGPGLISAAGGRPDTHDLKEGDYVLVHIRMIRKVSASAPEQVTEKYVPLVVEGEPLPLKIVDQSQIIAILEGPLPTEA